MGRGITDRIPMPSMVKEEQEMGCQCKCGEKPSEKEIERFNHFILFNKRGAIVQSARTSFMISARSWFDKVPTSIKANAHTLVNVYEGLNGGPLRVSRHRVTSASDYKLVPVDGPK